MATFSSCVPRVIASALVGAVLLLAPGPAAAMGYGHYDIRLLQTFGAQGGSSSNPPPELQLRLGAPGAHGHNLEVPNAAAFAPTHFVHLSLADRPQTFALLANYQKAKPADHDVGKLVQGIRVGEVGAARVGRM